jgi:hypothetical protein
MDALVVSETYTNNGFTIKAYDLNAVRPGFSVAQRLSGISPECPKTATMQAYLDDATTLEVAFQGSAPVAFLIAGNFEDDTDEHICPDNHPAFRQTVGEPKPAPVPVAPSKKEGVLKRMLESVKKRAKKDAQTHAKEVKKEADDVEKAVKEVQNKLKDLEKACSTGLNGGSSRVNRKTRRSKGKRRNTKRSKF